MGGDGRFANRPYGEGLGEGRGDCYDDEIPRLRFAALRNDIWVREGDGSPHSRGHGEGARNDGKTQDGRPRGTPLRKTWVVSKGGFRGAM